MQCNAMQTVCGDVPKGATRMYVGRPDANVHGYVVDEHMQLVAPGAPGELLLSGPRLAAGGHYMNHY